MHLVGGGARLDLARSQMLRTFDLKFNMSDPAQTDIIRTETSELPKKSDKKQKLNWIASSHRNSTKITQNGEI